ncbi:MAG TPA: ArsI/CadI family heavy metal resistance metalloenzyme [Pseudonocardiaceae bacterium]|nr:ArsI/CadI family heavy metal resistance metalloenzyme [Pseudonocardiaceae bacterium]
MSRVQLALRVADLDGSVEFYRKLFAAEPAKRRPGYANFAITEPPLKLVLIEGEPGQAPVMDHLGVEVESGEQVRSATARLTGHGLKTAVEDATTCCHAVQDKVWVRGPGAEPWEIYTVLADAPEATRRSPGSGQRFHQDVRIRRRQAPQVALIPGEDQPATPLHRDGDDMRVSEMF